MSKKLVLKGVTITYKPPRLVHRILSAMIPDPPLNCDFEYAQPKGKVALIGVGGGALMGAGVSGLTIVPIPIISKTRNRRAEKENG